VIYIDKGENAGIARDMAVITADGIVGKVLLAYPSVSQVLLINDQSSGVGAILEKSRLQGVLRGSINGEVILEKVMSDEEVQPGETLLTSGGDRIFPKGLPVGTVMKVSSGKDLFLSIRIKPAANLSKLEEVLVLLEKQEKLATADDKVRVRAADILAQRLPSVPDRPTADATSVGAATQGAAKPAEASAAVPKTPIPGTQNAAKSSSAGGSTTANQPAKPVGQGTPKQSVAPGPSPEAKQVATPAKPSITVQKSQAAPPTPTTAQPPADDNSPH
jgi:rod shape-determining protein MreC